MSGNDCLHLTVLGSGTCELRAGRGSAAHLVSAGGANILLDAGRGALAAMLAAGVEAAELNAVMLTHHHPDHMADLVPLLFALNYDPALQGGARVSIMGHPGIAPVVDGLDSALGRWLKPKHNNADFKWLRAGDALEVGEVKITVAEARHIATSLAYRLERSGASLVYLGDSEYSEELAEFSQGADLLLANCAATDQRPKKGHMGPAQCGRLAAEAKAGALLLSHMYCGVDPAEALAAAGKVFGGPVLAAFDRQSLSIAPGIVTAR